jgi:hypothetical protein
LIEQSDIEKANDDFKDELTQGTGATEEGRAETVTMDQDLIDARIDNTYMLLDSVMRESEYYERIVGLQNYGDLFGTADGAIEERWAMFRGTMTSMNKEKNDLIKNCEFKMRQAEI